MFPDHTTGSLARVHPIRTTGSMARMLPEHTTGPLARKHPLRSTGSMARMLPLDTTGSMARLFPVHTDPTRWPELLPLRTTGSMARLFRNRGIGSTAPCYPSITYRLDVPTTSRLDGPTVASHPHYRLDGPNASQSGSMAP